MTNEKTMLLVDPDQLAHIVNDSIRSYFENNPQSHDQKNDLLTITQAAEYLNCSIPTIYAKTSKRAIPFHKQGKRVYFSRRELERWVKEG